MDNTEQARWDQWVQAHIKNALKQEREIAASALGDVMREFDADIAKLRREMRDAPPLFSAPDKALSNAMVRVGEEIHRLGEGVEAVRTATGECARRADLGAVRLRLERRLTELEERATSNERNLQAASRALFNTSEALQRVHALLARLAVATDCGHVLTPIDKNLLPADGQEQPSAAVVISLPDLRLRFAESA